MFGHHDDNSQPAQDSTATIEPVQEPPQTEEAKAAEAPEPAADDTAPAASEPAILPDQTAPALPAADAADDAQDTQDAKAAPDSSDDQPPAWQHPGTPLDNAKEQISDVISPAGGFPKRPSYQYAAGKPAPAAADAPDTSDDDPVTRELIDVKEHALDELAPLLDKLDLPPEEKFRAIMMILQANDDKSLVKAAYAVAHSIEDEEARARALYTIVNEVDYFTHAQDTDSAAA